MQFKKTILWLLLAVSVFTQTYDCSKNCQNYGSYEQYRRCKNACETETGLNLAIIFSVLFVFFTIVGICLYKHRKTCRREYYSANEKKKRKVTNIGTTEQEFRVQKERLKKIFWKKIDNQWVFAFSEEGARHQMTFSPLLIDDLDPSDELPEQYRNYQHWLNFHGSDHKGVYSVDEGYLVNTKKGITLWFEKQYKEESEYNKKNGILLIYELVRVDDLSYQGQWYYRGRPGSGVCSLKKKGQDQLFYQKALAQETQKNQGTQDTREDPNPHSASNIHQ